MEWRVRKPMCRHRALHMWHKWFAWYPVRVPTHGRMSGMKMVWLAPVMRRGKFWASTFSSGWDWQYRKVE